MALAAMAYQPPLGKIVVGLVRPIVIGVGLYPSGSAKTVRPQS